ncbi:MULTISPECIES: hypothetical protein [unclassified Photorhabdus]|uniref:hypothetical protein n=1 Tax=unclassified Photorhabdus TaxID=2620880 RepID=UPI000DDC2B53|nr:MULTISPECIES: hypothetical protein [unclassified Photorhabdus]
MLSLKKTTKALLAINNILPSILEPTPTIAPSLTFKQQSLLDLPIWVEGWEHNYPTNHNAK